VKSQIYCFGTGRDEMVHGDTSRMHALIQLALAETGCCCACTTKILCRPEICNASHVIKKLADMTTPVGRHYLVHCATVGRSKY
jgi:hypothetical protein